MYVARACRLSSFARWTPVGGHLAPRPSTPIPPQTSQMFISSCFMTHKLIGRTDFHGQVLRYTALVAGILYGFQHQRTLYKKQQDHKDSEEYAHKEALIRKAKEEYRKKTSPPSGGTYITHHPPHFLSPSRGLADDGSITVITDPEDSRFDLEKFLQYVTEQKH